MPLPTMSEDWHEPPFMIVLFAHFPISLALN
jgi:hypothetical protein